MDLSTDQKPQSVNVTIDELSGIKGSLKSIFRKSSNICIDGKALVTMDSQTYYSLQLTKEERK